MHLNSKICCSVANLVEFFAFCLYRGTEDFNTAGTKKNFFVFFGVIFQMSDLKPGTPGTKRDCNRCAMPSEI